MSDTEHAGTGRYTLTVNAEGVLEIRDSGGDRFEIQPVRDGWEVRRFQAEGRLRIGRGPGGALTLEESDGDGEPVAWWTPPGGVPGGVAGGTVLLAGGDLFQVLDRPGRPGGYDLAGWQGAGPYFAVATTGDGACLTVHPAGQALLHDLRGEPALLLFAAVVTGLTSDRNDGSGES